MKAKDLAALAALGVAGYAAYDKFGKKGEAKKGEEMPAYKGREANRVADIEAESDEYAGMPAYQGRSANRLADIEAEAGEAAMPVAQPRSRVDRSAELQSEFGPKADASAAFKKVKAAAAPAVVAKPVATRSLAPAAVAPAAAVVEDDYVMPRTAPKPVMPDATRVKAYNPDIMYNTTVPFDADRQERQNRFPEALTDETEQNYARMLRQGTPIPHTMNQLAQARMKRQGTRPAQMPNDQAQARILRQGAPVARAKGGAVKKMASGGLASSKMSKPSGASRGDGIAQRGRTRGTLR
jgi:hypothetical protein